MENYSKNSEISSVGSSNSEKAININLNLCKPINFQACLVQNYQLLFYISDFFYIYLIRPLMNSSFIKFLKSSVIKGTWTKESSNNDISLKSSYQQFFYFHLFEFFTSGLNLLLVIFGNCVYLYKLCTSTKFSLKILMNIFSF